MPSSQNHRDIYPNFQHAAVPHITPDTQISHEAAPAMAEMGIIIITHS